MLTHGLNGAPTPSPPLPGTGPVLCPPELCTGGATCRGILDAEDRESVWPDQEGCEDNI